MCPRVSSLLLAALRPRAGRAACSLTGVAGAALLVLVLLDDFRRGMPRLLAPVVEYRLLVRHPDGSPPIPVRRLHVDVRAL